MVIFGEECGRPRRHKTRKTSGRHAPYLRRLVLPGAARGPGDHGPFERGAELLAADRAQQAGRPNFGGLVLGCIEADFYK